MRNRGQHRAPVMRDLCCPLRPLRVLRLGFRMRGCGGVVNAAINGPKNSSAPLDTDSWISMVRSRFAPLPTSS
jgi:hypothetical protein